MGTNLEKNGTQSNRVKSGKAYNDHVNSKVGSYHNPFGIAPIDITNNSKEKREEWISRYHKRKR